MARSARRRAHERRPRSGSPQSTRAALVFSVLIALIATAPEDASAHEVRPGYLELNALGGGVWSVLWKVPAKGDLRLGIYVRLPESCDATEPTARVAGTAHVERWRATCSDPLVGQSIVIDGLEATRTDVLARVNHEDGTTQTARLTSSQRAFEVKSSPSQLEVARTYLGLGVEHILLGVDHLLFVLALLFLVGTPRKLVAAITAFTVAHSFTLAAATLGWIRVASAPVEATIALSIVFVAAEVVRGENGLAARKPWLVAFAFGLLHGLGFAGALSEVGLPSHAIPVALALFNVGVEVGQLLFIALAFGLFKLASVAWRPRTASAGLWSAVDAAARPACYAIGILGVFWLIERMASFWALA
jgi:hypothetical protein